MSRGKIVIKPIGRILLRTAVILLSLAVVAVGTFSYAKYVYNSETEDSASAASMGIEIFELEERGTTIQNIDFTKVVPGADIPGPHIRLKINAEVNYSLFVKITQSKVMPTYTYFDEFGHEVEEPSVAYLMSEDYWTPYGNPYDVDGNKTVYTYKYNFVFKAGQKYNYTNDKYEGYKTEGEIKILYGDVIYVSQYYNEYYKGNPQNFTLSFETSIRQVQ